MKEGNAKIIRNCQKELDVYTASLKGRRPKFLVHACCAPCSSYVMEYLSRYFDLTMYFCNPNIDSYEEYEKRASELKRLVSEMELSSFVEVVTAEYENEGFEKAAAGLSCEPEGGKRCLKCFELRLGRTAQYMKERGGFEYFMSTLTISPLKDAAAINDIGETVASALSVPYLPSDFKKKNGYLRSIELSKKFGLYRQDYCGCKYSKKEVIKK